MGTMGVAGTMGTDACSQFVEYWGDALVEQLPDIQTLVLTYISTDSKRTA